MSDVLDITAKRTAAISNDAGDRIATALPVLLKVPPESMRGVIDAVAQEVREAIVEILSPAGIDLESLLRPHHPEQLKAALRQSLPSDTTSHEYLALYATAFALMRTVGALNEIGQEAQAD